ncbi:hypothetical protein [Rhodococcus gannanensis]|uniref:Uncharacterized protein n=1 Tax=Rhodococcus gannanensis TaxID=1960308 RepID=A0ABW4P166_9NOCA
MTGVLLAAEAAGLAYLVRVAGRAGMGDEAGLFLDRYRAASALDADGLHADAEALRSTAAVMRAHLLAQEQAVARLRGAWSGDAADAALATLTRHQAIARAECVAVLATARTLDDAGDLIREAALARTEFVGRTFGQRTEDTDPDWSPAVLAAHATACLAAMTDLIAAVEDVVEEARRAVEAAVAEMWQQAEPRQDPVPDERPAADSADHTDPEPVAPPAEPLVARDVPTGDGPGDVPATVGQVPGVGTRRARDAEPGNGPSHDTDTGAELAGAGTLAGTDPV